MRGSERRELPPAWEKSPTRVRLGTEESFEQIIRVSCRSKMDSRSCRNSSILITGCTHSRSHAKGWLSGSCVGVSGNASLPRGVGSLHCRMAETVG